MTDLTLGQIRGASPCPDGWTKLLRGLGYADGQFDPSRRVTLGDIAASNGAVDAWRCIRCLDWDNITVRRAVIAALLPSVKRASSHTADARVHTCIAIIEQWLAGDEAMDLPGARAAARAASLAAARASWAAEAASWAASRAAAGAAWAAWAAEAAEAARAAAWAAEAATGAAEAAWKAMGAAWAAETATGTAAAAWEAMGTGAEGKREREAQRRDLINTFGRTIP